MTRMIVALDGVTFNQARESGTLSTLAKACEKNMIWGGQGQRYTVQRGRDQNNLDPEG